MSAPDLYSAQEGLHVVNTHQPVRTVRPRRANALVRVWLRLVWIVETLQLWSDESWYDACVLSGITGTTSMKELEWQCEERRVRLALLERRL